MSDQPNPTPQTFGDSVSPLFKRFLDACTMPGDEEELFAAHDAVGNWLHDNQMSAVEDPATGAIMASTYHPDPNRRGWLLLWPMEIRRRSRSPMPTLAQLQQLQQEPTEEPAESIA